MVGNCMSIDPCRPAKASEQVWPRGVGRTAPGRGPSGQGGGEVHARVLHRPDPEPEHPGGNGRAVWRFCQWCDAQRVRLQDVSSPTVATYRSAASSAWRARMPPMAIR